MLPERRIRPARWTTSIRSQLLVRLAVPGRQGSLRGNDIAALTSYELDVLTLIGKGLSNKEIADELCISGVTVKSHIGRIFGKLDLPDRAAAIVYGWDNDFVAPR
jgi:DNA-binding NarL/FixJ family response regulator